MVCPYCGAKVEENWTYCMSCEKPLPSRIRSEDEPSQAPRPKAEEKAEAGARAELGERAKRAPSKKAVPRPKRRLSFDPIRAKRLALRAGIVVGAAALLAGAYFAARPLVGRLFVASVFARSGETILGERYVRGPYVSKDEKAVAYIAETAAGNEYVVVRRGASVCKGKPYPAIANLRLSNDGRHWVYIASRSKDDQRNGDYITAGLVVRDEAEGKAYDYLRELQLSGDGKHVAYIAGEGGSWSKDKYGSWDYGQGRFWAVRDNAESEVFDDVQNLTLSESGGHVAFAGGRGVEWSQDENKNWFVGRGRYSLVRDGKATGEYDYVPLIRLSADGKVLAAEVCKDLQYAKLKSGYWDQYGGKVFFVLNGKESEPYDTLNYYLDLSRDGRHFAYHIRRDVEWRKAKDGLTYPIKGKSLAVVDGIASEPYDSISFFAVSPDYKRVAYVARVGGEWREGENGTWSYGKGKAIVVFNGKKSEAYDYLDEDSIAYSADLSRFSYIASNGGEWHEDSDKLLSYGKGKWYVCSQDKRSEPFDWVSDFSGPDEARHLVYVGHIGCEWSLSGKGVWRAQKGSSRVVVDGKASEPYNTIDKLTTCMVPFHVAYEAASGSDWLQDSNGGFHLGKGKRMVVIDGIASEPWDWIENCQFFLDDKQGKANYVGLKGGEMKPEGKDDFVLVGASYQMVTGGKVSEPAEFLANCRYSTDGSHVLYTSGKGGQWKLLGDSWSYTGGDDWQVVYDGRHTEFKFAPYFPLMSPNGLHIGYIFGTKMTFDADDPWWNWSYYPSDKSLRISIDGETMDKAYANSKWDMSLDDKGWSATMRTSEDSEFKQVSGKFSATFSKSGYAYSSTRQERLWIESSEYSSKLVVEKGL
jgi:hypothetical protein